MSLSRRRDDAEVLASWGAGSSGPATLSLSEKGINILKWGEEFSQHSLPRAAMLQEGSNRENELEIPVRSSRAQGSDPFYSFNATTLPSGSPSEHKSYAHMSAEPGRYAPQGFDLRHTSNGNDAATFNLHSGENSGPTLRREDAIRQSIRPSFIVRGREPFQDDSSSDDLESLGTHGTDVPGNADYISTYQQDRKISSPSPSVLSRPLRASPRTIQSHTYRDYTESDSEEDDTLLEQQSHLFSRSLSLSSGSSLRRITHKFSGKTPHRYIKARNAQQLAQDTAPITWSTISKDNTPGEGARKSVLLAEFGRKTQPFVLGRTPGLDGMVQEHEEEYSGTAAEVDAFGKNWRAFSPSSDDSNISYSENEITRKMQASLKFAAEYIQSSREKARSKDDNSAKKQPQSAKIPAGLAT